MNSALLSIAERRITQAIEEGTLRTDSWKYKPLPLDSDSFVPDDLKMAYKVLKNSGFLPPEIETRKEIQKLEDLIARTEDEHLRVKQMKKLNVLMIKLDSRRSRPCSIEQDEHYYRRVVEKITVRADSKKP